MASVHDGCVVCNYFYRWGNIDIPSSLQEEEENSGCCFSVFSVEINWERSYFRIHIFTKTDRAKTDNLYEDIKADRNINFDFEASTNSASTWSFINDWMEKCTESHQACRQPDLATSYRPTRLLQMNESNSFRLVQGSECPTAIQYAALSYCWGSKPAHSLLRLLRSTMSGLSEWQPVDGLPKTFRDAMNVAQRPGVYYLWIDRLCIFQDSAEDWRHEASTMQDVYRNAYIGIRALGAKDDEGGCFFERDPAKAGPTVFSFKMEPDGKMMNFMCRREEFWSWRYTFQHEPLCQRSWVVQERLLAPRTLYFGSKQVFWECRARTCCEMHPEGMDSCEGDPKETPTEKAWKQLLAAERDNNRPSHRHQLFFEWDVIVELYANLQLTRASDKLVALSGLANDMQKRLNEWQPGLHRYLAGLWEDESIRQLTWFVSGSAKRASQYRAPSWSWACLDGKVTPGTMMTKVGECVELASMISAEMVYLSKEETGEVKSGILTLEGPCMWAKLPLQAKTGPNSAMVSPLPGLRSHVWFDTLNDVTGEAFLLWTYYDVDGASMRGLVLALIENDRYRRLGSISASGHEEDIEFVEALPKTRVRII
ncbi:heterokaryon incompatibility protein [Colletotrichum chrysophilum]|uniref:Heterokaryon incompatibility protein n=1 Tax=Colletotrichum chrysophilum TaxID=1836956 RepID=A0AAD9AC74_9PEZI|nr:heterokaryon incompatibility protein [Colletotrichum chrysophilum]